MKNIVGIIAEYNPYHNGHRYQMEEARIQTESEYVIALISGHFVQRGEPAIYDTITRAKMALFAGADAVFEMPVPFSTASAEDFAAYGVSLLSSLGVQNLSFGSENASANELGRIASILINESPSFVQILKELLSMGNSYPEARMTAVLHELRIQGAGDFEITRAKELLTTPNNILGIEYMKAKYLYRSPIQAFAIHRSGSGYHDTSINPSIGYASASAIRQQILYQKDFASIQNFVPTDTFELILNTGAISSDDITSIILRRVLSLIHDGVDLAEFVDVSNELARRIESNIRSCDSFHSLIQQIKTKQYTYTRISRAICHILLGIRKKQMELFKAGRIAPYARLIGFRRESAQLLSQLKLTSSVPIISRMADASDILQDNPSALALLMEEVHATEMYNSIYYDKYHIELPSLYTKSMVIV